MRPLRCRPGWIDQATGVRTTPVPSRRPQLRSLWAWVPWRACRRLLVLVILMAGSPALAWGERGHDVVTRVAVQRLDALVDSDKTLLRAFQRHTDMLSHVANVPDIVWRHGPEAVVQANAPTHAIALDAFLNPPSVKTLSQYPKPLPRAHGTAPWRTADLAAKLVAAFERIDAAKDAAPRQQLRQIVLYAGLLSHFVADLAQPHHATADSDGWQRGQGGVHRYFETRLVNALPLSLPERVLARARKQKPARAVLDTARRVQKHRREAQAGAAGKGSEVSASPPALAVSWALALDSFARLPALMHRDKAIAVRTSSQRKPKRKAAKRRPAHQVAGRFQGFIVQRMALAADVLAHLWLDCWRRGGAPKVASTRVHPYPLQPDFVPIKALPSQQTRERAQ